MADIVSPLPGMFYASPGPDKDPFVAPGDRVEAGQVVGLIEVMKQFSEIRSEVAGVVESIAISDGAAVTPGTVLMTVTEG
jgi:acetyl-CoA carboxylase biotin carboxyl carrier protein